MTTTPNPKIEIHGLSVHYNGRQALSHVELSIPERQVTAIIGPSGCGKSTLLRALNRMHELSDVRVEGKVLLDGEDILAPHVDPVEVRKRIGMVFQQPNPFAKSIFENVAYGLRIAGERDRNAIEQRVRESLEGAALWDEVKDRLNSSALGLSGGQRQRLCIARAIAIRPDVLLLDEPASSLDPIATGRIEDLLLELEQRYTLVLVTHSMQEARRVADHVAFLYMGELVEVGTKAQIFDEPHDPRTRAYVHGGLD